MRLHYSVGDHTWIEVNEDGTVTVGMTDVAQNLAGPLLHAKPKKVGAVRAKGKPVATVESSKWVGPVKTPVAGEVTAINDAVAAKPGSINKDPYGEGWLVKLKPTNLDAELGALVTGAAVAQAFEAKMTADGFAGC